jgi:hypothetical protein
MANEAEAWLPGHDLSLSSWYGKKPLLVAIIMHTIVNEKL